VKRGTMYSQVFARETRAGEAPTNESAAFTPRTHARLRTMHELLDASPRPFTLLGEKLPNLPDAWQHDERITMLPAEYAVPRSEVVWLLGRQRAADGQYDDPITLNPLYIREPEAVTLWRENQKP